MTEEEIKKHPRYEAFLEYRDLYYKDYGIKLTLEEAMEHVNDLFAFYRAALPSNLFGSELSDSDV